MSLIPFFGKAKKYGADKTLFHKENFKKVIVKPRFYTNMLVKEKNCTSTSQNGLQHSNLFIDKLNQAIRYAQIICPSKYATRTVTGKAARQNHNDNDSIDSDDSTPPRKRGKKEDDDTDFMGRYYCFFLGSEVNANNRGPLQWIQWDNIHSPFTKLKGTCKHIY